MDMLFFLLAILCVPMLFLGLINPKLVIKWGSIEKKTRGSVFKYFGVGFLVFFVAFIFSISGDTTDNSEVSSLTNTNTGALKQQIVEDPYAQDIEKIAGSISGTFKGKNHSIIINEENERYVVSIAVDAEDSRFIEPIWCGVNGLSIIKDIKYYHPELDNKISIYNLDFFAEDFKIYSAIIENSEELEIKELSLTSIDNNESVKVTSDDVKSFHEKLAEEERLAKEKEAALAEAEYNSGITYNQLARTPDDYINKKVKFTGKVIQVMESGKETQLRIAVNDNYDDILLVFYNSNTVDERILDNDKVSINGISQGLYTYTSVLGGNITIPFLKVDKIIIK